MDRNMTHHRQVLKRSRLVCLFICGILLFNFPLITIFDHPFALAGIPLIYLYLFFVWSLLIGAVFLVTRRRQPQTGDHDSKPEMEK